MEKVKIEISCINAAFDESAKGEIIRILFEIARHIERGNAQSRSFLDTNGNDVCSLIIE